MVAFDDLADSRGNWGYPIHPKDKILKEIEYGDKKAFIFMGGFGIERMRLIIGQKYLRRKTGLH